MAALRVISSGVPALSKALLVLVVLTDRPVRERCDDSGVVLKSIRIGDNAIASDVKTSATTT